MDAPHIEPRLVVGFAEAPAEDVSFVGGKGANLAILTRAGFPVPPGFCVTTAAFDRFLEGAPHARRLIAALDTLKPDDLEGVRAAASQVRDALGSTDIPGAVRQAVLSAWRELGPEHAYAVRSSATLEDLADASFAGQQDTFLNIRGEAPLLEHLRRCWISLFNDRAVLYRQHHRFGSSSARLSVVVQRMVQPDVSGVLFTADPMTGHRGVCAIEATYGLGEALVSGMVNADLYRVDKATGALIEVRLGEKASAIQSLEAGGTQTAQISAEQRRARALGDAEIARLAELGRRIEAHQGQPQDVEWALAGGTLHLLQARPITTLYPVPEPRPRDGTLHVYLSFGHIQVNTAALSPMSLSLFPLIISFGKRELSEPSGLVLQAGGRLYLDATPLLRRRLLSLPLMKALENIDPTFAPRIQSVVERPDFQARRGGTPRAALWPLLGFGAATIGRVLRRLLFSPASLARRVLEGAMEAKVRAYTQGISSAQPGAARLRAARGELTLLFPEIILSRAIPSIASGIAAWKLIGRLVGGRVDARHLAALSRGLSGNVTTDMDLELGDLADAARAHPAIAARLRQSDLAGALEIAKQGAGGERFLEGWERFIARYGHRCAGEIDIAIPRWSEDPTPLVSALASMLEHGESGAHRRKYAAVVKEAQESAATIVEAAGRGPLGALRRPLVRALVARAREHLALREHHKFLVTQLLAHVRRSVLETGRLAAERGLLEAPGDVWMLGYDELIAALEAPGSAHAAELRERVSARKEEHGRFRTLSPPAVLTSEGEAPRPPARELPPGVLAGTSVSGGIVEGIARVVHDPGKEVLSHGEILVAAFTDPGWTPLFMNAAALVMEVGGLMTHGSVVAREVGIPAVVGVEGATRKIRTGQRIRVDGDLGFITLLEEAAPAPGVEQDAVA